MADPARDEFKKNKSDGEAAPLSMTTFAGAKTVEAVAKAGLRQLELQEKKGKLINADETKRNLQHLFTTIKTRIRAIPNKTAQEVTHMVKAKTGRSLTAAVQEIIRKETDEALIELSRYKVPGGKK